jgi:hypothetical protein
MVTFCRVKSAAIHFAGYNQKAPLDRGPADLAAAPIVAGRRVLVAH